MATVYSVSQVNSYIKEKLEGDSTLLKLFVRGEISNFKVHAPTGNCYFSLKDGKSAISCVLFQWSAARLKFSPANGMQVVAYGDISVYPPNGTYSLKVTVLTPDGVGDRHLALEQLKEKLAAKGYFDAERKRQLPRYPNRIALVTSDSGDAVWDMIRKMGQRWPMAEIRVIPTLVQGEGAGAQIAQSIRWVNEHDLADVMVVGRGGGSEEVLWCFNDEVVADAIFESRIPVVSAVGHRPDHHISDDVADVSAFTPTDAAVEVVPDQEAKREWLGQTAVYMARSLNARLEWERRRLERLASCRMLRSPMAWVDDRRVAVDHQWDKLCQGLRQTMGKDRERFGRLAATLDALSPLKVLGRGYSIVRSEKGVVKSVSEVKKGDKLKLKVSDGDIPCTVDD